MKAVILIDGSNFYFKLKDQNHHNLIEFDFSKFNKLILGKNKLVSATYYIGGIKNDGTTKTKKLFDSQQKLLSHLLKSGYKYSLGYLMKNDGKYHEKGVDVNLAVDLLVVAYENIADIIYIVSSDTDLLPAIKKAKEKGKVVEYVGFSHKPSIAMVANSSKTRLLTNEDIETCTKNPTNDKCPCGRV